MMKVTIEGIYLSLDDINKGITEYGEKANDETNPLDERLAHTANMRLYLKFLQEYENGKPKVWTTVGHIPCTDRDLLHSESEIKFNNSTISSIENLRSEGSDFEDDELVMFIKFENGKYAALRMSNDDEDCQHNILRFTSKISPDELFRMKIINRTEWTKLTKDIRRQKEIDKVNLEYRHYQTLLIKFKGNDRESVLNAALKKFDMENK